MANNKRDQKNNRGQRKGEGKGWFGDSEGHARAARGEESRDTE